MGIIEKELAAFTLSDNIAYKIEYNAGDVIHLHVDKIRVDFSVREFKEFSSVILNAQKRLREVKYD